MKKCLAQVSVLLILMGLAGCGSDSMEPPELLEPVDVKMDVAKVQKGEIYEISTYNGEVVPYVKEVYFSADGYLDQIHVTIGDTVQKEEVLATLDNEQILEQIKKLEEEINHIVKLGEFDDRKANLDIEIACEELAVLQESGAFAQTCEAKELEIQKLRLQLEQTRELRNLDLQEKQSSLEMLRENAGKNQLTAPFSGTVVYISDIGKGDSVQAYAPVIYLADDSQLSLSTDYIPETNLTTADRIYAKIMDKEYEISYIPYDRNEYIAMMLHGEEVKTQFSFHAADSFLESGQFAAIMVIRSYRENVLTIPVNALYRDGTGRYVYKQADGQRVRCDVTAGVISDTKAEIVEGLEEGDMVYVKD